MEAPNPRHAPDCRHEAEVNPRPIGIRISRRIYSEMMSLLLILFMAINLIFTLPTKPLSPGTARCS